MSDFIGIHYYASTMPGPDDTARTAYWRGAIQRLPNCAAGAVARAACGERAAHCSGNAAKCAITPAGRLFSCHVMLAIPMQIVLYQCTPKGLKLHFTFRDE
jgi:hypothetical protein